MKIFLTGGTGYIGGGIRLELARQGHQVVVHARNADAADRLEQSGLATAVGDLADRAWVEGQLAEVDAAIHAASPNDSTSADLDAAMVDSVVAAFAGTGKPYVHTAGVWVHGSGPRITETTAFDPPRVVAWRPAVIQRVRQSAQAGIRTVVLSPGNVYGNGGGLAAMIVHGPSDSDRGLLYPGDGGQHFSNVHVADLARAYVLALTAATPGDYLIVANTESPTMAELAAAASGIRGLGGRIAAEDPTDTARRLGPVAAALLLDQRIDAQHARDLGWAPQEVSLLDDLRSGSYS